MVTNQKREGDPPPSDGGPGRQHSLEYARNLFQNIAGWYNNADAKAQIVLGLAGAFVAFLTASAFVKKDDLTPVLEVFGPETWFLLGLTLFCLCMAVLCAFICLISRKSPEELKEHVEKINDPSGEQSPETLWFFGHLARLKDRQRFQERIEKLIEQDELRALSSQIFFLSKNVAEKHLWVKAAFWFVLLTLFFFILSGANYVCRVRHLPTATAPKTVP